MKTYYYTTEEFAKEAIECGLKLSHAASDVASVYGKKLPCIVTYIHPADCPRECRSNAVLKLRLEDGKAFVAEGLFTGERYATSLVAAKDYRIGTYRKPVCLVICSVLPEQIEAYDPAMDEPLFYESSESLYRDTVMSRVQESEDFKELALMAYYDQEAAQGRCIRVKEQDSVIYLSGENETTVYCCRHV